MANTPIHDLLAFDLGEDKRPEHDPWWRIARGELSPEDAIAERRDFDGADEDMLRKHVQLYAPPSAEARGRALDELLARFFTESSAPSDGGRGPEESGEPELREATSDDRIVDLGAARRRRSRVVFGAVLAVAAAAVLTWALVPRGPEAPGEPMPGFAPEWSNQYTGSMRSVEAPEGCQRYKIDGRLEVRLRPDIALADDLMIAALARSGEGTPRRLAIDPIISAAGVITIDQSIAELGLTPGEWTVSLFVSRGAELSESELAELSPADHPEIVVIHSAVCIEQ